VEQTQKKLSETLTRVHKPFFLLRRWVVISVASLITVSSGTAAVCASYELSKQETILPRVSVGGVELGRLTRQEADQKLSEAVLSYLAQPFVFSGRATDAKPDEEQTTFEISPEEMGLQVDVKASVEQAYNLGHDRNFFASLQGQVESAFGGRKLKLVSQIDEAVLTAFLDTAFLDIEKPARDARLSLENGQLKELASRPGSEVVREPLAQAILGQATSLTHKTIELTLAPSEAAVHQSDLAHIRKVTETIQKSKVSLFYQDKTFSPPADVVSSWLEFHTVRPEEVLGAASCECGLPTSQTLEESGAQKTPAMLITPFEQERQGLKKTEPYYVLLPPQNFLKQDLSQKVAVVGLNRNKLNNWLLENVSAELDVPGQDARLAFKDGTVSVTTPSKNGIGVDIEQAARDITFKIATTEPSVKLTLKEAKPTITEDRIQELGITTLIGKGVSDFTGSSTSRLQNIKVGFSKLNGMVFGPGEEFSTVSAIAPVDAAAGYLPELVITGNKIRPEYGGGLCQVSSTLFRAALDTGLPITERTNHAFSVHYYVWPYLDWGVEATIYDPEPDLKFENDTQGHILIHAYVIEETQKAVVEFYGTDPGRTTTIDGPYRLSGSAAAGGTTVFNYTVKEDATGKEVRKQEFTSIFQPLSKFKLTN
jgi:vancomycin resistance protein YoaR